jgi:hypothetical protein
MRREDHFKGLKNFRSRKEPEHPQVTADMAFLVQGGPFLEASFGQCGCQDGSGVPPIVMLDLSNRTKRRVREWTTN